MVVGIEYNRSRRILGLLVTVLCVVPVVVFSGQDSVTNAQVSMHLGEGPNIRQGEFHEGLMIMQSRGGHGYHYVDVDGRDVFGKSFRICMPFQEGVALVCEENSGWYRFIDRDGRYLSESHHVRWVKEGCVSEGLMAVQLNRSDPDRWGFVNTTGQIVVKPMYYAAGSFHEGLAAVRKDEKWGYIDRSGHVGIGFKYDDAKRFSGGVASVRVGATWGCIDRRGQWVKIPAFDELRDCSEGAMSARKDGKWGAIDSSGNILIPFVYDDIGNCSEGLIRVRSNETWGFLDRVGTTAIAFRYVEADDFHEGTARVAVRPGTEHGVVPLYGYISHGGSYIVEPVFFAAYNFSEGLATVIEITPHSVWIIDRSGRELKEVGDSGR
jgi:hypothetical protein